MATKKNHRNPKTANKSTNVQPNQGADQRRDSGMPGGGQGRTDVTGTMPGNVRVDPNITEGHPGYDESGSSEIIPNDRLHVDEDSKG